MIYFNKFPKPLTALLRQLLKLIPNYTKVPIIQGYNKGYKIYKGTGPNSYWLGHFEYPKQKIIAEYCKENKVCWDVGAHVGFYSLLMSKNLGEKGKVIAIEPAGNNLYWLYKHLRINKINNVAVLQIALYDTDNIAYFNLSDIGFGSQSNITQIQTQVMIPIFKGDTLIYKYKIPAPNLIKIDVEGAEYKVIKGLQKCLIEYEPILLIAIDNYSTKNSIVSFLKNIGYSCHPIKGLSNELICKKGAVHFPEI